jgi:hypothetical protein
VLAFRLRHDFVNVVDELDKTGRLAVARLRQLELEVGADASRIPPQNDHAVSQQNGLFDVVCDHEDRASRHLLAQPQFKQFTAQVLSGKDVERGKGFAMNRTSGSTTSARAKPTRCFMPPESSLGYAVSNPVESDGIEHLQGALPALNRAHPAGLKRSLDIFEHVQPRK